MKFWIFFLCALLYFIGLGCGSPSSMDFIPKIISVDDTTGTGDDSTGSNGGNRIFIVDQSGKSWDITHAVNKYGFIADQFQYGIGPFAIPPIQNPDFFSPGESGYPGDEETFLMMGVMINDEERGYPLNTMSRHEVVDEVFISTHVAVAY